MVKEVLKYFKNAGIVLEIVDGSVSVSSKSLRIKLTEEESEMITKYSSDIINDLSSITTSETGEGSKIISTYSPSTQKLPPLKRNNPNIVNTFNGKTGDITGVNSVNSATGDVKFGYVSSFNGATGAITGVNSFNGNTGAITGVNSFNGNTGAIIGVDSVNGATGSVTAVNSVNGATGVINFSYVSSFNGSTGAVDVSASQTVIGGVTLGGGGATFGGDVVFKGNLLLPEDGEVGIGGDTEKIVFNGTGSGSSSIDIKCSNVDFGLGSGSSLRSHGDADTEIKFNNDKHGSGNDGLELKQSGNVMIDVGPGYVNTAGVTFGGGGATFGGEVNLVDNQVSRPTLKDYAETVNAIGSVNSNTAVNFENGNVQTVTVAGNCEFSFSNPPASGKAGTVTLIITNGGAHTTTFASPVKWPSDVAPSLTSSGVDIVSFLTTDAGTNIYGFVGGLNFS